VNTSDCPSVGVFDPVPFQPFNRPRFWVLGEQRFPSLRELLRGPLCSLSSGF
jgi:hypothetical protein